MAGSTIGVVQVVLSARDDSLAREFRKATKQIESFKNSADAAFKLMMGTEMTRKVIRGLGEIVDYMTLTTDEARKMGIVLGDDTRNRLQIAEASFQDMTRSLAAMRVEIADAAAPALSAIASMIADSASKTAEFNKGTRELEGTFENLAVVVVKTAQAATATYAALAAAAGIAGTAITAAMQATDAISNPGLAMAKTLFMGADAFSITTNTAKGAAYNIDLFKRTIQGSWADDFRDQLNRIHSEIAAASTGFASATAQMQADRKAREERQKQWGDSRDKYFAQLDASQEMADAKEAIRIKDATQKYALAAAEREAIWQQEQAAKKLALDMDPTVRAEFVGRAESDPRVKYERDVAAAIQDGKTMAEARRLADEAQKRDLAVSQPGTDVRVLREAEVDRLVAENRKKNRDADEQQTRQHHEVMAQAYGDFFGNLATITAEAAKDNVAMFYTNKALSMAQAEINAWMAYSSIMGNPTLGTTVGGPMQLIMAYSALAAGQVAVAQIAAAQPAGRANGGSVSRGTMYQVNERGPELLTVGDKSFLMMGNRDGTVTPNSGSGAARAGVTVNVHNAPGTTARVEQTGTADAPRIDVIIERVDAAIASGIRSGAGTTARALQSTYGLNRARGAS